MAERWPLNLWDRWRAARDPERSRAREFERAARAIDRMARHRLSTDHPWLTQFPDMLSEEFLEENVVHHRPLVELIEELASVGTAGRTPRLLESGAGSAAMGLHFSRRNYDVLSMDDDPLMVLRARHISAQLGGYAKIVCMDLDDLGRFPSDAFDVAFSQGTFEHWDNATIRRRIARQLEVAAHVVLSTPSIHWPQRDFVNERKMSVDEWKTILADVDAELLQLGAYHRGHHILAALRRRERGSRETT